MLTHQHFCESHSRNADAALFSLRNPERKVNNFFAAPKKRAKLFQLL